jgi:hypothetical protein
MSAGYSPFLNFVVTDLDTAMARMMQLGAAMDGPVLYPAHGKVRAAVSGCPYSALGVGALSCFLIMSDRCVFVVIGLVVCLWLLLRLCINELQTRKHAD